MSDECELTTYAEMVDVVCNLHMLVREKRRERRVSLRQLAAQSGVSASAVCRLESGNSDVSMDSLIALLQWLHGYTNEESA
jgi:transcriptional regulator with XRE-family HTH domain